MYELDVFGDKLSNNLGFLRQNCLLPFHIGNTGAEGADSRVLSGTETKRCSREVGSCAPLVAPALREKQVFRDDETSKSSW